MNDENIKYLSEKYNDLFIKHYYKEKLMPFWFECGDGWFNIIDRLCNSITHEINHAKEQLELKKQRGESVTDEDYEAIKVTVVQIKEKYGGLRFYTYGSNDYIRGMIDFAESMSYKICECCGNPGTLSKEGWWRTMCEPCRADDARKKAEWDANYKQASKKLEEEKNDV
jgi:hypothetical protein